MTPERNMTPTPAHEGVSVYHKTTRELLCVQAPRFYNNSVTGVFFALREKTGDRRLARYTAINHERTGRCGLTQRMSLITRGHATTIRLL